MLTQISAIPPSGIQAGEPHLVIVQSPLHAPFEKDEKDDKEKKVAQKVKIVTALDGESAGGVKPVDDPRDSFPSPLSRFSSSQTR